MKSVKNYLWGEVKAYPRENSREKKQNKLCKRSSFIIQCLSA